LVAYPNSSDMNELSEIRLGGFENKNREGGKKP